MGQQYHGHAASVCRLGCLMRAGIARQCQMARWHGPIHTTATYTLPCCYSHVDGCCGATPIAGTRTPWPVAAVAAAARSPVGLGDVCDHCQARAPPPRNVCAVTGHILQGLLPARCNHHVEATLRKMQRCGAADALQGSRTAKQQSVGMGEHAMLGNAPRIRGAGRRAVGAEPTA